MWITDENPRYIQLDCIVSPGGQSGGTHGSNDSQIFDGTSGQDFHGKQRRNIIRRDPNVIKLVDVLDDAARKAAVTNQRRLEVASFS